MHIQLADLVRHLPEGVVFNSLRRDFALPDLYAHMVRVRAGAYAVYVYVRQPSRMADVSVYHGTSSIDDVKKFIGVPDAVDRVFGEYGFAPYQCHRKILETHYSFWLIEQPSTVAS